MRQRTALIFTAIAGVWGCIPDHNSETRPALRVGSPSPLENAGSLRPRLELGPTIRQADPPPPLSGGTIAVTEDGDMVVAADPDRDRVYLIDIRAPTSVRTIALSRHDEPGRVAIDDSSRAHVVLRGAGAVVTIDLRTASIVGRRAVCPAPRGIAVEHGNGTESELVHVACAGGDLVTLPSDGGPEVRRRFVARDLRDVAVMPGWLALTTFRDGQLLRISSGSDVVKGQSLPASPSFGIPRVAWRMIVAPRRGDGGRGPGVLVAAQRAPDPDDDAPPPARSAEYYQANECRPTGPSPVVHDGSKSIIVPNTVLPVDLAATEDTLVVVAAGNAHTPGEPQLVIMRRSYDLGTSAPHDFSCTPTVATEAPLAGVQITSVAFASHDTVVVALSREPAALVVLDAESNEERSRIELAVESREDTGHAIFHSNSGAGVACASCHPDGHDDGHSWRSQEAGARRTPSLLGTIANTAPYHWNGEARDMTALVALTFESRMQGPRLGTAQIDALDGWLRALPPPPALPPRDPAAAKRGEALFETPATCARCHNGAMKTNNATRDAGTGGKFQVPSLVGVGWRAPYLHDGSAATLASVLGRGHAGLSFDAAQIADLAMYLETL